MSRKWYRKPKLYLALLLLVGPVLLARILPVMLGVEKGAPKDGKSLAADSLPRIIIAGKVLHPCELRHVMDGDTIRVRLGDKLPAVRFLRINTPEKERFGYHEATAALRDLLVGGELFLELEQPGTLDTDKFYRLLCYVHARMPGKPLRNINVEMVRSGWTPFWRTYGDGKYAADLAAAQEEARAAGRGLWARGDGEEVR